MVGNRGLYAPTIRWNDGRFYIICTNVVESSKGEQQDEGHHFIISTADIDSGEWTDPVFFEFDGGDPSLYFEDGRAFVQIANAADTSIHQFEINVTTGEKLSESRELLPHSGRKWAESPHIYKRGDYYYLLLAEGGCFEHHMISIARSKELWGPFEPHPENPILTAFGSNEYVQHVGHADFVEDTNGEWWAVCLAVRKDGSRYPLGRETFLAPVTWLDDGWPGIATITMECSSIDAQDHRLPRPSDRDQPRLAAQPNYLYIREKAHGKYDVRSDGLILLHPGKNDIGAAHGAVTFIGECQRSLNGKAEVRMSPLPAAENPSGGVRAGLAMYKDEHRFLRIYYDSASGKLCFEAINRAKRFTARSRTSLELTGPVTLIMRYSERGYELLYRLDGSEETVLLGAVDASSMTNLDFVGPVIGLFAAQGENDPKNGGSEPVQFDGFEVA